MIINNAQMSSGVSPQSLLKGSVITRVDLMLHQICTTKIKFICRKSGTVGANELDSLLLVLWDQISREMVNQTRNMSE
jgi:hypothetical protein